MKDGVNVRHNTYWIKTDDNQWELTMPRGRCKTKRRTPALLHINRECLALPFQQRRLLPPYVAIELSVEQLRELALIVTVAAEHYCPPQNAKTEERTE